MRSLLLVSLLLFASVDGFAAKRLSNRGLSYLPSFGVGSTSSVAYTGSAASTFSMIAADGSATALVRLYTTTASFIAIGAAPIATSAGIPLAANTELILEIPSTYKISAVPQASNGLLYATHLIMYPASN